LKFYNKRILLEGIPDEAILKIEAASTDGTGKTKSPLALALHSQQLTGTFKGAGVLKVKYNGFRAEK
jgi:hypothetical protein